MTRENLQMRQYHLRLLEQNGGEWFDCEPHLAALYRAILQPGSIAIDGGANIGLHTLQMAQAVLPNGLVAAVDPLPELLKLLDGRLHEYRIPETVVRLLPAGLASSVGEADFYQVLDHGKHGLSSLRDRHIPKNQVEQVKPVRIELTTLDAVCRQLGRVDFIKLDLEGGELDALRGSRLTLDRFRPVIAFEQDQYSPRYFGYTWDHLLEFFASMRYEVYDLFGLRYTEAAMFELCAVWDFVGLPVEYPDKERLFGAVRRSMELAGVRIRPGCGSPSTGRRQAETEPQQADIGQPPRLHRPGTRPLAAGAQFMSQEIKGSSSPWPPGWAVDEHNQSVAGGVDVVIDEAPYGAVYWAYRPDVADHFRTMAFQTSGFLLLLPPGSLSKGRHMVYLRVISHDLKCYYPGPALEFTVD